MCITINIFCSLHTVATGTYDNLQMLFPSQMDFSNIYNKMYGDYTLISITHVILPKIQKRDKELGELKVEIVTKQQNKQETWQNEFVKEMKQNGTRSLSPLVPVIYK